MGGQAATWIDMDQVNAMADDYLPGPTGTETFCASRSTGVAPRQAGATGPEGARPP